MNNNFLFNFNEFVEELRNDENKREVIEKYEENNGSLQDRDYKELPLYKDYLSKFELDEGLVQRVKLPEALEDDFDYPLLLRLVAGSFSSNFIFEHCDETDMERLKISVKSGEQSITKYLDDLWSFQITRLFEIYFEEQMNYDNLQKDSEDEEHAIAKERESRLESFKKKMSKMAIERELAPKRLDLLKKFRELIEVD